MRQRRLNTGAQERFGLGCVLVGGQMVHLHCIERGQSPLRATTDLDAVLDVRARPQVLRDFTQLLTDLGFTSAGTQTSDSRVMASL